MQVNAYGGWEKLDKDVALFRQIMSKLSERCKHVVMESSNVGVHRRSVCVVAQARLMGIHALFDEGS